MPQTWRDGSTTTRSAADLELADAAALHASQHAPGGTDPIWGVVAADIDSAITPWDDPLGIGFASPVAPNAGTNQNTMTASRAVFARALSGGVVNFLRYYIFTQAGNIDFGIYANTGSGRNARPGSKLWSSGSFPCPVAGAQTLTVSPGVTVKARQHWFGFSCDNASLSIYTILSSQQIQAAWEGWGQFKDATFPLPSSVSSLTNGVFKFPIVTGSAT